MMGASVRRAPKKCLVFGQVARSARAPRVVDLTVDNADASIGPGREAAVVRHGHHGLAHVAGEAFAAWHARSGLRPSRGCRWVRRPGSPAGRWPERGQSPRVGAVRPTAGWGICRPAVSRPGGRATARPVRVLLRDEARPACASARSRCRPRGIRPAGSGTETQSPAWPDVGLTTGLRCSVRCLRRRAKPGLRRGVEQASMYSSDDLPEPDGPMMQIETRRGQCQATPVDGVVTWPGMR